MEYGNPRAKIVGFVTVLLIISLLIFITFKIVDKNQKEKALKVKTVTYQEKSVDIDVNGDYLEYIKKGNPYIEKGVKATSKDGEDLSNRVIISYLKNNRQVANVDTNTIGSYLVSYTIVNPDTNKVLNVYKTIIIK